MARALLFTNHVPKYLWDEAILNATYLINRMPSKILHFQTPINVFYKNFPTSRISADLPIKIFGCTVFVHNHDKNHGKFDLKARKCVFLSYAPAQKGYKCFDPTSRKLFVTMDVSFF